MKLKKYHEINSAISFLNGLSCQNFCKNTLGISIAYVN